MADWQPHNMYNEGDEVHFDGKDWVFHDGKFREKKRTAVEKFYLGLWWVLKVLMVLALIAFIVWLRIRFDTWYVNWLMK